MLHSILPSPPAGTRRVAEAHHGEEYVSVGVFPPGAPRRQVHAYGVASLFWDADCADWYLATQVSPATPGIEKVTAREGTARVKQWLHGLPQGQLDAILDDHQAFLVRVLEWLGIEATHITRSGYGHHVHVHLDRWYTTVTDQDRAREYTGAVIDFVQGVLGFSFFDAGANLGAVQLCRELNAKNRKGPHPQVVRRIGGTGLPVALGTFSPPLADFEGGKDIRDRAIHLAGLFRPERGQGTPAKANRKNGRLPRREIPAETVIDGLTLPQWGIELPPGGKRPVCCPGHEDSTASAFVAVTDGGVAYACCPQVCGATYWAPEPVLDLGGIRVVSLDDSDPAGTESPPPIKEWFSDTAGPLLALPPEVKIVVAAGDLGSGKSTWLAGEIAQVKRATVIMHRQALAADVARTMPVEDYQQIAEVEIDPRQHPKVVITPNSLWRLGAGGDNLDPETLTPEAADDLVIIEECEATLRHWYGGTMRRGKRRDGKAVTDPPMGEVVGGEAFTRLLLRVQFCFETGGRLVLADAFPGRVTRKFIEVLCGFLGLDPTKAVRDIRHPVPLTWNLRCLPTLADTVHRIGLDVRAGKRVAVACTSARAAIALADAAKGWVRADGTLPTVLLHHRDQTQDAFNALKNVVESWGTPDLLIYSPTVDSGVSYDRADAPFDRRYLLAIRPRSNRTGSPVPSFGWREALQMSRRVRDCATTDPDIYTFLDPTWRHGQTCDPDHIRAAMVRRAKMSVTLARKTDPEGNTYLTALRDPEHFEVGVAVEVAKHADSRNVSEAIRQAFRQSGVRIIDEPGPLPPDKVQEFNKQWKNLKAQHDQEVALAWFYADFLSMAEFLDLRRRHKGHPDDDQRASLARTKRIDFFGPAGGEQDHLLADIRGEEHMMVHRHITTRLVREGHLIEAAAYDRANAEPGYQASMTIRTLQAAAVCQYLTTHFRAANQVLRGGDCPFGDDADMPGTIGDSGGNGGLPSDLKRIVPRIGGSPPRIAWAQVPRGVSLEAIRLASGCPDLVDAGAVEAAVLKAIHRPGGIGASALAGSGCPTKAVLRRVGRKSKPQPYPHLFLKALWEATGQKTMEWQRIQIDGHRVRIYTLDPKWVAELKRISERQYRRARGLPVESIEQIDPKAPALANIPSGVVDLDVDELLDDAALPVAAPAPTENTLDEGLETPREACFGRGRGDGPPNGQRRLSPPGEQGAVSPPLGGAM